MQGARLGNWVIDKELGHGGMGRVFLAHAAEPGREPYQAALKVLSRELATDEGFLMRFQREIEILHQLNHPNIVRIYDSGVQDGLYFYAMEYVAGRNHEELLAEQGRLSWPVVLEVALQVCPALKHAHDRGVIHRDLKPSNLLQQQHAPPPSEPEGPPTFLPSEFAPRHAREERALTDFTVKLTDFGIAHVFARPHLTATGGIIGTAEFLSPEQAAGKPVSKRSDLYSFGVVLYTLLTGHTPFEGEEVPKLLHQHRFGQFERPRHWVPDIPHDLEGIVCQLLEKDPAKRPGDAMVLHRQLDSVRRKLAFKTQQLERPPGDPSPTVPGPGVLRGQEGPATLMSRLVREELDRQNKGGPVARFFNRFWVLLTLLFLCVGLIVWGLWPPGADGLFRQGEKLMASNDPHDWDTAWEDYFDKLQKNYPNNPYQAQIEEYRRKIEDHKAQKQANKEATTSGPLSEAHWFFVQGQRLRQQGAEAEARRVWNDLVRAFRAMPAEQPWVKLAEQELDAPGGVDDTKEARQSAVRAVVQRARQLRADGKVELAHEILEGLESLYREDPSAKEILEEIRQEIRK
jgi:serine/threonine-protein kinase